ncbi:MAG: carboxypeptidase-like regulatory domain-containing protein [Bacteroidetes bacterium]|nr:carboxypeptidase-like regulatory domain-containing protein [Bacteroidota bacterium]
MFILIQLQCLCQSNFTITGIAIDNDTKEPVPYVYVKVVGTETYFVTDSMGKVLINSPYSKPMLSFEHLNYKKVALAIDTLKKTAGELTLVFRLQKKENALGEIVISGKTAITNMAGNIIDYNFIGNRIVALNYKAPPFKSELILLSEQLDTLNMSKLLFEPESLFKDCFGNIHVLSADSSYQVFYQNNILHIYAPYLLAEFEKKLGNCYTSTNDCIYFLQKKGAVMITNTGFHDFLSKNNALSYIYFNKQSKQKGVLFDVVDKRHEEERKNDREAEKIARANQVIYKNPALFRETILLEEIYAPLLVIHDSLILFDFINHELTGFKNNRVISKTPIDFHKTRTWKRLIIFDDIKNKVYSKYLEDGKLILKDINFQSGKAEKSFTLPTAMGLKLKIMNGNAYYLLKSNNNSNFSLSLQRVPLQ